MDNIDKVTGAFASVPFGNNNFEHDKKLFLSPQQKIDFLTQKQRIIYHHYQQQQQQNQNLFELSLCSSTSNQMNNNNFTQQQSLQCLPSPLQQQQQQQQLISPNIRQNHYSNLQSSPIPIGYYGQSLDCNNALTPISASTLNNHSNKHSPKVHQQNLIQSTDFQHYSLPSSAQQLTQSESFNKNLADKQENICDMISLLMTYDEDDSVSSNVNNQMQSYQNIQSSKEMQHDQLKLQSQPSILNWYNISNDKIDNFNENSITTNDYSNFPNNNIQNHCQQQQQHQISQQQPALLINHNSYNQINDGETNYEKSGNWATTLHNETNEHNFASNLHHQRKESALLPKT